jgi:hypothetical protein
MIASLISWSQSSAPNERFAKRETSFPGQPCGPLSGVLPLCAFFASCSVPSVHSLHCRLPIADCRLPSPLPLPSSIVHRPSSIPVKSIPSTKKHAPRTLAHTNVTNHFIAQVTNHQHHTIINTKMTKIRKHDNVIPFAASPGVASGLPQVHQPFQPPALRIPAVLGRTGPRLFRWAPRPTKISPHRPGSPSVLDAFPPIYKAYKAKSLCSFASPR